MNSIRPGYSKGKEARQRAANDVGLLVIDGKNRKDDQ
jgi:hypothetical protein